MHLFTAHRRGTKRRFAHFDLPDNPLCWALGHSARVEVMEPGYNIDPWVLIECRRCGRRYNGDPSLIGHLREKSPAERKAWTLRRVEFARTDPAQLAASASGRDGYSRAQAQFSYEHGTGQKWRWFSAGIHVGTRHSESPWHAHLYVPNHSFHVSAGGVLQRFAHWLGAGHKRDLEVSVSRGKYDVELAWKLWYDDDGGSDQYHDRRCKERPVPWDRFLEPRRRYRTWRCARDGSIPLNPATVLWGRPTFHREEFLPTHEAIVNPGEFPGDHYLVTFTLERAELRRDRGPAWARRVQSVHWSADWRANPGLPVQNNDWKGDEILGSSERVSEESVDDEMWLAEAVRSLEDRVRRDRVKNGYRPPADRFEAL